eukprot:c1686_g1_i1 orf=242-604(+)
MTEEEVRLTIHELPRNKTPGLDGIPSEVLQIAPEMAAKKLLKLYREAWCRGGLPREVNTGVMILVPKKSNPIEFRDWRPLTMLIVAYKVLAKVMARRLVTVIHKRVNREQKGFMIQRSMM